MQQAPEASRLKIRHALSGNVVCFPGPATAQNAWSLARYVWDVKDLVGHRIIMVCAETNTLTKQSYMVSAVLTRSGDIAPDSYTLDEVATNGCAGILTGESVVPFRGLKCVESPWEGWQDVYLEVNTPPTPPPQ